MPYEIFVLGLDDENRHELEALPGADDYRFHALLSIEELTQGEININRSLANARAELDAFPGSVDAIVGYWDFPISTMVPILCHERGLPSASLAAVLKCEHKYWSRLEQQRSIEEFPRFSLIELDANTLPEPLNYPAWIKPVKSFSSELAFHVRDDRELQHALQEIKPKIGRVGSSFDAALEYVDLPDEIAAIGGQACLVEESVCGQQVTVEGFHDGNNVHVYGVIDSYTIEDTSCFERYQYPSALAQPVIDRLAEVSRRVIEHIGLYSTFNIEYFWNPDDGAINLLEINPRITQSHTLLLKKVDGVPNDHYMVQLALGHTPGLSYRQGHYPLAAKWFCRRFSTDARVHRSPTAEELAEIEHEIPGVHVEIAVEPGKWLSELPAQDSYSYNLGIVHVGANNEQQLHSKHQEVLRRLPFEFDEPD